MDFLHLLKTKLFVSSLLIGLVFSQSALSQGSIKGRVVDAETSNPLEFTNVALLFASDSSLATGSMTDMEGEFLLSSVKPGRYLLRITYVGYDNFWRRIELTEANLNRNLGNLNVRPSSEALQEVVVEAAASLFESEIDKRVFNVENSIVAEGGTAMDVLETIPSIQVDDDGGISLRGSGSVLVFINGKQSNLAGGDIDALLEQFPANSIEKVEVITNPSSRYDAAGVGGIINIVLKKNKLEGFNGQANTSIGTRNKYTGGINLNYRKNRVNLFTNYSYQNQDYFRISESTRTNDRNGIGSRLDQDSYGLRNNETHFVRSGMELELTEKASLGVFGSMNINNRRNVQDIDFRNFTLQNQLDSIYDRNSDERRTGFNYEVGANYTLDIDTTGQKLLIQGTFSQNTQEERELFTQLAYDLENTDIILDELLQRNLQDRFNQLALLQADYELPLKGGASLEAGLKSTFRITDRDQLFEDFNPQSGVYELNPLVSNRFRFDEQIHGGYVNFRHKFKKFGYQLGLRGEQTITQSEQFATGEIFDNNYLNFFPSVFLSYQVKPGRDYQVNYSRRINRPSIWNLNPFLNISDPLNPRQGNPFLNPELTDSYEVSYLQDFGKLFMTGSVYFRDTRDVITRIVEIQEGNVALTTFANVNRRTTMGLELINQVQFFRWWDATLSGNFFRTQIFGDNLGAEFNNQNLSWSLNLISNMRLPKGLYIQMQGNYRGPIALPQGEIAPFYGLNMGVRKDVLKNKGTVSLNVSDVFNTRIFIIETAGTGFEQRRLFNRETQVGTLTFTYRFGGFRERKGRNGRGDREDFEDSDF